MLMSVPRSADIGLQIAEFKLRRMQCQQEYLVYRPFNKNNVNGLL